MSGSKVAEAEPSGRIITSRYDLARTYLEGFGLVVKANEANPKPKTTNAITHIKLLLGLHDQQSRERNPNLSTDPARVLVDGNLGKRPNGTVFPYAYRRFEVVGNSGPRELTLYFGMPTIEIDSYYWPRAWRGNLEERIRLQRICHYLRDNGFYGDFGWDSPYYETVKHYLAFELWERNGYPDKQLNMDSAQGFLSKYTYLLGYNPTL